MSYERNQSFMRSHRFCTDIEGNSPIRAPLPKGGKYTGVHKGLMKCEKFLSCHLIPVGNSLARCAADRTKQRIIASGWRFYNWSWDRVGHVHVWDSDCIVDYNRSHLSVTQTFKTTERHLIWDRGWQNGSFSFLYFWENTKGTDDSFVLG